MIEMWTGIAVISAFIAGCCTVVVIQEFCAMRRLVKCEKPIIFTEIVDDFPIGERFIMKGIKFRADITETPDGWIAYLRDFTLRRTLWQPMFKSKEAAEEAIKTAMQHRMENERPEFMGEPMPDHVRW